MDTSKPRARGAAGKAVSFARRTPGQPRCSPPSQRACTPSFLELTRDEEQTLVERILDIDRRGHTLQLLDVEYMADYLLLVRSIEKTGTVNQAGEVSRDWAREFVDRSPALKTCLDRNNKSHQGIRKDSQLVARWLKLVQETKAKYSILDEDTYDLGEASFRFDLNSTATVLTASERQNRRRTKQQEAQRWATVLQGINASGWALPPYTIVKSERRDLASWHTEEIPHDWAIAASDTGWTTNPIAYEYIQEFEVSTRNRTTGTWRLLILDGYQSDRTVGLDLYCQHFRLITLCMPPGLSNLLQPFDLGCSLPLKVAYAEQIKKLMQHRTAHITQSEFLLSLKASLEAALTPQNIAAGFQSSGLVPFHPEAVCLKSPATKDVASWEAEIPNNTHKVEAPLTVMQEGDKILIEYIEGLTEEKARRLVAQFKAGAVLTKRIATKNPAFWEAISPGNARELETQLIPTGGQTRIHRGFLPLDIVEQINKLQSIFDTLKDGEALMEQVATLEQSLVAGAGRRKRKRVRIQRQNAPIVGKRRGTTAQRNSNKQQRGPETCRGGARLGSDGQDKRHCRRCRKTGHNSRTCNKDSVDTTKS